MNETCQGRKSIANSTPVGIEIEIPGTPVAKGRPRMTRSGHVYTPEKTRNYEAFVKLMATEAMRGLTPLEGPLIVGIMAWTPIPGSWGQKKQKAALAGGILPVTKPDVDNLAKTLDALNQIVWHDDSQIVDLAISKRYSANPRLTIRVRRYPNGNSNQPDNERTEAARPPTEGTAGGKQA